MARAFLGVLPLFSAACAMDAEEVLSAFAGFKTSFRREYANDVEEAMRLENFRVSLENVQLHNAQPSHTWKKGINQFSDMSHAEFTSTKLMESQDCSATTQRGPLRLTEAADADDLPPDLDWRERRGIISEVKDQGHCGSCWAFSTVGCLEAHLAIKYDSWRAPRLSEQQLIDCAQAFDNNGCKGGLPSHAFEYIKHAGGLDTEFHYHYLAEDGICSFNASVPVPKPFMPRAKATGAQVLGGSFNLTAGDEMGLKYHLATHGPVSVAYKVVPEFKEYASGVWTPPGECASGPEDAQDVNHAVLAVGYGTDPVSGLDYWLCKNSWDYSFGEEGFFKISAFNNTCGIADCMSFPDLYGLNDAAQPESITCVGVGCHAVTLILISFILGAIVVLAAASFLVSKQRSRRRNSTFLDELSTVLQPEMSLQNTGTQGVRPEMSLQDTGSQGGS